jgi:hypothetical protein
MLIAARTLSALSVILTLVVIDALRMHLLHLPLGFEAYGFAIFLSLIFAILFAVAALVIVGARARSGTKTGFAQVALLCAVAFMSLAVVVGHDLVADWLSGG